MLAKLIIIVAMMFGPIIQTEKSSAKPAAIFVNTTIIYKSADSQGVDIIWLAACQQGTCEGTGR
jgi:hypothetical protein